MRSLQKREHFLHRQMRGAANQFDIKPYTSRTRNSHTRKYRRTYAHARTRTHLSIRHRGHRTEPTDAHARLHRREMGGERCTAACTQTKRCVAWVSSLMCMHTTLPMSVCDGVRCGCARATADAYPSSHRASGEAKAVLVARTPTQLHREGRCAYMW